MNTETIKTLVKSKGFQIITASVLSAAASGTAGYFFAKKRLRPYYEEISTREISEAKEFYGRLHKNDEDNGSPEKVLERLHGKEAVDALKSYQGNIAMETSVVAEKDSIIDSTPEITVFDKGLNVVKEASRSSDFDYDAEVELRTEESPYIITHDEYYEGEKEYEQVTLTYFDGDDVLVDERDQPVPDPDDSVGDDHLARFGFGSNDNNIVYIRNDRLELDFEIIRSNGKYAKEVLGFIEHSERRGVRKFRHDD